MRTVVISPEAERVMAAGFRERKPAAIVAGLVRQATGETVAPRTISRRAAAWRAAESRRQAARDQMNDLVSAMKANDLTAEEMLRALAVQALLENGAALQAQPVDLQMLRIEERKVALRERAVENDARRIALLETREKRAVAAADELAAKAGRGESISPDDLQKIRDIYGLGGPDE